MDQAELRRQLREQLDQTQREQARLATLRKRMQYEWAEEHGTVKVRPAMSLATKVARSRSRRAKTPCVTGNQAAQSRRGHVS